jgi:hypothetical protein
MAFELIGSTGDIKQNLTNGLQIVGSNKNSPYNALNIVGRTLVNLLGRVGNCEDTSKWIDGAATVVLDTTNKVYGNSSIKLTASGSSDHYRQTAVTVQPNRYYVFVGEIKPVTGKAAIRLVTQTSGAAVVQTPFTPIISDTTKFSLARIKLATGSTEVSCIVRPQIHNAANAIVFTAAGENSYFDGIRMYEVTLAEYDAFDALTDSQIAAKYPYLDDVKHVNAPYVIKYGENLLPSFNEWTLHANAVATEPYKLTLTATALNQHSSFAVSVIPNTTYTFSNSITGDSNLRVGISRVQNSSVAADYYGSRTGGTPVTFTTEPTTYVVYINFYSAASGTFILTNPMLNLGATAKPFKPRNDDSLFFPNVQLASSVDGTVYDTLYKDKGKYFVERRFKDMVLDGSLAWVYSNDFVGVKQVRINAGGFPVGIAGSGVVTKYDGKIILTGTTSVGDNNAVSADGNFYLGISDTDSGWGESYAPTSDEVKAYFYGWRMFQEGQNAFTSLYTSGTKWWVNRATAITTSTLPTVQIGASTFWTSYKLTYQLASPVFEEIAVDAGMSLHEGLNQLEVGQGVVVREKVVPSLRNDGLYYGINTLVFSTPTYTYTALKNRTNSILTVYKNGRIDNSWTIGKNGQSTIWSGGGYAYNTPANYDTTATYEVSYIALDQYLLSAPVQTVTGETASNLKTVVDAVAANQADVEARVSASELLARQIYNVPQKTSASMTLYVDGTNGADNNDGSLGKPFKTIQQAINSLPQMINHAVTINVAAGTYAEDVVVKGFSGGGGSLQYLTISGDVASSTSRSVNSFLLINNTVTVSIVGFNITSTTQAALSAVNSSRVTCFFLNIVSSAMDKVGINSESSTVYVNSSVISNRGTALQSHTNGQLMSNVNSGTGSTYSSVAQYGGKVTRNSTQPSGLHVAQIGGINTADSGVLNPWGDNTAGNRSTISAYQSSAQTLSAGATTKLVFQTKSWDSLTEYDNTTNYRFTAKHNGVYLVNASMYLSNPASNNAYSLSAYKNGGQYSVLDVGVSISGATANRYANGSVQIQLNAGDYVEIYGYSTLANTLVAGSLLMITQIA